MFACAVSPMYVALGTRETFSFTRVFRRLNMYAINVKISARTTITMPTVIPRSSLLFPRPELTLEVPLLGVLMPVDSVVTDGSGVGATLTGGAATGAAEVGATVQASQCAGHDKLVTEVQPTNKIAFLHSGGSGPCEHTGVGKDVGATVGVSV